jgi:hypothetical protein
MAEIRGKTAYGDRKRHVDGLLQRIAEIRRESHVDQNDWRAGGTKPLRQLCPRRCHFRARARCERWDGNDTLLKIDKDQCRRSGGKHLNENTSIKIFEDTLKHEPYLRTTSSNLDEGPPEW